MTISIHAQASLLEQHAAIIMRDGEDPGAAPLVYVKVLPEPFHRPAPNELATTPQAGELSRHVTQPGAEWQLATIDSGLEEDGDISCTFGPAFEPDQDAGLKLALDMALLSWCSGYDVAAADANPYDDEEDQSPAVSHLQALDKLLRRVGVAACQAAGVGGYTKDGQAPSPAPPSTPPAYTPSAIFGPFDPDDQAPDEPGDGDADTEPPPAPQVQIAVADQAGPKLVDIAGAFGGLAQSLAQARAPKPDPNAPSQDEAASALDKELDELSAFLDGARNTAGGL